MKRFKISLAVFLAGLPSLSGKGEVARLEESIGPEPKELVPVELRPLNLPGDNLFAQHRSHSSHGSHRSHRSGSGGGTAPESAPGSAPPGSSPQAPGGNRPADPSPPAPVKPPPGQAVPELSLNEKRKLQIMRVQLALNTLGLYTGPVDGALGDETKKALTRFQVLKGLEPSGLMTTETLNALGVPAVK